MKTNKLSVAAILLAAAGIAMAVDAPPTGKTREQVRAELAQARASGEYDALTMLYTDPFPQRRATQTDRTPADKPQQPR